MGRALGKVAVVCGGSRGLGRAIAHELARRGSSVAICARSADDLERTRVELEAFMVPVFAEACDLRSDSETRAFLERASAALGPIDLLVTNAATITVGPVESAIAADFHDAMGSIFGTALHPALAVLPSMRARRKGTIAFIASVGGKIGVPHLAPYSAAKFAEVGLAEALRAEVAKDAVRIVTVIPGLMRTGSALRATFQGVPAKELAWFGAAATAPILSIDADTAARRIVSAIARGDDEVVLTVPARIALRAHALAPSLWSFVMKLVGRLLPRQPALQPVGREEGTDIARTSSSPLVALVRRRQEKLARRHGQLAGPR